MKQIQRLFRLFILWVLRSVLFWRGWEWRLYIKGSRSKPFLFRSVQARQSKISANWTKHGSLPLPNLRRITAQPVPTEAIPQLALRNVATKLSSTDNKVPGYWPTVFQFIQFATENISPNVPPAFPRMRLSQMT